MTKLVKKGPSYNKKEKRWYNSTGQKLALGKGYYSKNINKYVMYGSDGSVTKYSPEEWKEKLSKKLLSKDESFTTSLGRFFRNATIGASMAENPAVMQASGWEQDKKGNYKQKRSEGSDRLAEGIAAASTFSPTNPANAALRGIGTIANKTLSPAVDKAVTKVANSKVGKQVKKVINKKLTINPVGKARAKRNIAKIERGMRNNSSIINPNYRRNSSRPITVKEEVVMTKGNPRLKVNGKFVKSEGRNMPYYPRVPKKVNTGNATSNIISNIKNKANAAINENKTLSAVKNKISSRIDKASTKAKAIKRLTNRKLNEEVPVEDENGDIFYIPRKDYIKGFAEGVGIIGGVLTPLVIGASSIPFTAGGHYSWIKHRQRIKKEIEEDKKTFPKLTKEEKKYVEDKSWELWDKKFDNNEYYNEILVDVLQDFKKNKKQNNDNTKKDTPVKTKSDTTVNTPVKKENTVKKSNTVISNKNNIPTKVNNTPVNQIKKENKLVKRYNNSKVKSKNKLDPKSKFNSNKLVNKEISLKDIAKERAVPVKINQVPDLEPLRNYNYELNLKLLVNDYFKSGEYKKYFVH